MPSMLEHFYHYTGADKWRRIQSDDDFDGKWPGLRLGRPLAYLSDRWMKLPAHAYDHVVYGFLEAEPQAWFDQTIESDNRTAFEAFMGHAGDATSKWANLKVRLHQDDDAWVFDRATLVPFLATSYAMSRKEAKKRFHDYWNSKVHVRDYTGHETMQLPEVVSFTPIPLHRVQCIGLKESFQLVNRVRKGKDAVLTFPHRAPDIMEFLTQRKNDQPRVR